MGTTARIYLMLDFIPYGGHKDVLKKLGHFYVVGLPYGLFGAVLILIALCIALQVTLTNNAIVGCIMGSVLIFLSIVFACSWIWADRKLCVVLKLCLSNMNPQSIHST